MIDAIRNLLPNGESNPDWMREMMDIEKESSALQSAREVPLCDMTQDELQVVILHDPDLTERRAALRLYRIDILADAEIRIMTTLAQARK